MTLVEKMFTRLEVKIKSMRLETECLTLAARIGLEDREALLDLLGMVGLRYVWAEPGSLSIRQHTLAQIVLQEATMKAAAPKTDKLDPHIFQELLLILGPLVDCDQLARLALAGAGRDDTEDKVTLPMRLQARFQERNWTLVARNMLSEVSQATDIAYDILAYFCHLPQAARLMVPAEFGAYLCELLYVGSIYNEAVLLALMQVTLRSPGATIESMTMLADERKALQQMARGMTGVVSDGDNRH